MTQEIEASKTAKTLLYMYTKCLNIKTTYGYIYIDLQIEIFLNSGYGTSQQTPFFKVI